MKTSGAFQKETDKMQTYFWLLNSEETGLPTCLDINSRGLLRAFWILITPLFIALQTLMSTPQISLSHSAASIWSSGTSLIKCVPLQALKIQRASRDESRRPLNVCVASSREQTQFLSRPVGMPYWVGHTILSKLGRKDKDGEVPNKHFQTMTIQ